MDETVHPKLLYGTKWRFVSRRQRTPETRTPQSPFPARVSRFSCPRLFRATSAVTIGDHQKRLVFALSWRSSFCSWNESLCVHHIHAGSRSDVLSEFCQEPQLGVSLKYNNSNIVEVAGLGGDELRIIISAGTKNKLPQGQSAKCCYRSQARA